MILAMKRAVTQSLGHRIRCISTFPSQTEHDTVRDTFNALDSLIPGLQDAATPEQIPLQVVSNSKLPPILNIPPVEDPLLHFLTSMIQKHGHRAKAARITSRTLLHLHTFTRAPPMPILRQAIAMASPAVKSLSHRHGAKNVHKPVALGEKQRTRFALQWVLKASDNRPGQTLEERLARELIAVIQGDSEVLKKKEEVHRFAMVNRGNAQVRN